MAKIPYLEFIDEIARKAECSRKEAHQIWKELKTIIIRELKEGKNCHIAGMGTFELRWMKERTGKNPASGQPITIPAHGKAVFKAGESLKRILNKPFANMSPVDITDQTPNTEEVPSENKTEKFAFPDQFNSETPGMDDEVSEEKVEEVVMSYAQTKEETKASSVTLTANQTIEHIHTDDRNDNKKSNLGMWLLVIGVILFINWLIFFSPDSKVANQIPGATENVAPVNTVVNTAVPILKTAAPSTTTGGSTLQLASHSVQNRDNLWNLAKKYYGDPFLWPIIYMSNSDTIQNPNLIYPEQNLNIPKLNGSANQLAQYDLERLALGNLMVYGHLKSVDSEERLEFLKVGLTKDPLVIGRHGLNVDPDDLARVIKQSMTPLEQNTSGRRTPVYEQIGQVNVSQTASKITLKVLLPSTIFT